MNLPQRKSNRLKDYDYSTEGAYFVTVCTKGKEKLLCNIVGEGLRALPKVKLTDIGKTVEESIAYINSAYAAVKVDKHVIMPNHIHLLITIDVTGGHGGPPLQTVIGRLKSYTTHKYGSVLWQRSFYDHVIRSEHDYREIWEYIDTNPAKWAEDKFYIK